MATRTEIFRHQSERGKRHEVKRKAHLKRRDTHDEEARNLSGRAGKKAMVVAEETHGRRTRKSSRASSNRGKNSSALEYASRERSFSAQSRHGRR
jgi:hypothetical protein